ncbi:uncharacterized protein LOC109488881 [Ailuropoda melanoleuca]|uniref:uncharacterized protein LOC109488881 n=1 Tax=Ailuropoda melanoleuca TaxID=9646 RepID=UPI0014941676|nr:uncharacterized protein LOC109488881 [Ailuropoda melanoleuca]
MDVQRRALTQAARERTPESQRLGEENAASDWPCLLAQGFKGAGWNWKEPCSRCRLWTPLAYELRLIYPEIRTEIDGLKTLSMMLCRGILKLHWRLQFFGNLPSVLNYGVVLMEHLVLPQETQVCLTAHSLRNAAPAGHPPNSLGSRSASALSWEHLTFCLSLSIQGSLSGLWQEPGCFCLSCNCLPCRGAVTPPSKPARDNRPPHVWSCCKTLSLALHDAGECLSAVSPTLSLILRASFPPSGLQVYISPDPEAAGYG